MIVTRSTRLLPPSMISSLLNYTNIIGKNGTTPIAVRAKLMTKFFEWMDFMVEQSLVYALKVTVVVDVWSHIPK